MFLKRTVIEFIWNIGQLSSKVGNRLGQALDLCDEAMRLPSILLTNQFLNFPVTVLS